MSFSDAELIAFVEAGGTARQLVAMILAGRDERRAQAAARRAGQPVIVLPTEGVSAGAMRMRRMRERQRLAASHEASPSVTPVTLPELQPDTSISAQGAEITSLSRVRASRAGVSVTVTPVTPVTRGRQKEVPPKPPLRKTLLPPDPPGRHAASPDQIWLDGNDPIFRELEAMRGRSYSRDKRGGWWFDAFLVDQAKDRLKGKVSELRPSSIAIAAATGPPHAIDTG